MTKQSHRGGQNLPKENEVKQVRNEAAAVPIPAEETLECLQVETGIQMAVALLTVLEGSLAQEFGGTTGAGVFHVTRRMTAQLNESFDEWWAVASPRARANASRGSGTGQLRFLSEALAVRLRSIAAWLHTACLCEAEAFECYHDEGLELAAGYRGLADQAAGMLFTVARSLHPVENRFGPSAPAPLVAP